MQTVTKTITFSWKTSATCVSNPEYNKRFIDSGIGTLRIMFDTYGFVTLNQIKQILRIKESFKKKPYLKECMLIHSKDDYETFEPVVSQDKDDPSKFKITIQFVDYSKEGK